MGVRDRGVITGKGKAIDGTITGSRPVTSTDYGQVAQRVSAGFRARTRVERR